MFTLIRPARAITIVCISVVTLFGVPAMATADPTDNQANDKLFALISPGYTPADCQASKPYPEGPLPRKARLRPERPARWARGCYLLAVRDYRRPKYDL